MNAENGKDVADNDEGNALDIARLTNWQMINDDGRVFAELGVSEGGLANYSVFDADGTKLISLNVDKDDSYLWVGSLSVFTGKEGPESGAEKEMHHSGIQTRDDIVLDYFEDDLLFVTPDASKDLKFPEGESGIQNNGNPEEKRRIMSAEQVESTPETTQFKSLEMVDDVGKVRARLSMRDGLPQFTMYDQNGTGRMLLGMDRWIDNGGPGIFLADDKGTIRLAIAISRDEAGIFVYDFDGNLIYRISSDEGSVGFSP